MSKWIVDWSDLEPSLRRLGMLPAREFARVRASAALELGIVKAAAVAHENAAVRRTCITILDHLGGADAGPVLLQTLNDPAPRNRLAAIHALTCTRCKPDGLEVDPAAELRRVALDDPHDGVRAAATASLPVDVLIAQTLNDPSVRVRVAAVAALLVDGTDPALDAVRALFAGEPDTVRAGIRRAPKGRSAARAMDRWVRQRLGERWTGDADDATGGP